MVSALKKTKIPDAAEDPAGLEFSISNLPVPLMPNFNSGRSIQPDLGNARGVRRSGRISFRPNLAPFWSQSGPNVKRPRLGGRGLILKNTEQSVL